MHPAKAFYGEDRNTYHVHDLLKTYGITPLFHRALDGIKHMFAFTTLLCTL